MSNITIQDVAKAAGVSASSVSNLLNGRPERMKAETRQRIERAIETLGYKPSGIARHLKTGQSPMVGLLVPSVANPYYGELAVAIEFAAYEAGIQVVLCNTLRDARREVEFASELMAYGVRGLITASALSDPHGLSSLVEQGASVVAFDVSRDQLAVPGIDVVTMDNEQAVAKAVRELAALGHRRIAYATAPLGTRNREARAAGYLKAIDALNFDYRQQLVASSARSIASFGDTDLATLGREIAMKIQECDPRPTAVVAMNDMLAIGILVGLREAGIRVPEQISVVGIDDINLSTLVTPTLSTMRQPFQTMADTAIGFLKERLNGLGGAPRSAVFEPEFIRRGSISQPAN
jgi:DNA-binding LacI/PurR family transcriptional regulator